ncbi:MAG: glutathione peroxidase [Oceanobacter sp.]
MTDVYDIDLITIDGKTTTLKAYEGKALLIVNVASKCGLTPQYEKLQACYNEYKDKGLEILGFPCNQFKGQEPGSESEIKQFCQLTYDVNFPMFAKLNVNGRDRHPLYRYLIEHQPAREYLPDGQLKPKLTQMGLLPEQETDVLWNFEKFLVDRKGHPVGRFAPDMTTEDEALKEALENVLAS